MKNNGIKIKQSQSSLSEFVQRPLASDEEAEAFEQYAENKIKEKEIKDSIVEIYRDGDGNKVDVGKTLERPKRSWFFNLFVFATVLFACCASVYGAYNYIYLKIVGRSADVSLEFQSKKEIAAGEEFYYDLNYNNESKAVLNDIEIQLKYPENFIFIESDPAADKNNNIWRIQSVNPRRGGAVRIKGKLAGQENGYGTILAEMFYTPKNFSSEFKKSASFETKINSIGLDFSFNSASSAIVGETNEIAVKFAQKIKNYIDIFRLSAEHSEEIEIMNVEKTGAQTNLKIASSSSDLWILSDFGKNENEFKIKFKIKEKKQPNVSINLKFALPDKGESADKYYLFYEKNFTYDAVKSDLNMNLIINGSPFDQGTDFGQTLNFSVNYANKGDDAMKDIIIMAVLESDFLDWQTLVNNNGGKISGNSISWSKLEIPELEKLPSGAEGAIDFSIKIKKQSAIDLSKSYVVKSYAQYSSEGKSFSADSRSNAIMNKINSDLNLTEQVRYFNNDNIAVGYGPIPPKAGQVTSLKIYWSINNNLHELSDLRAVSVLPSGVKWDGKNRASIGSLDYDASLNQIIWHIGLLPATVLAAEAEFNISVNPGESDRNKIMIILPGTNITAIDKETNARISKTLKTKTTKLEDDNMAASDGIVQ